MTRLEAYTKVNNRLSELLCGIKEAFLFPFKFDTNFGTVGKTDEPKGSWLRNLKAKNYGAGSGNKRYDVKTAEDKFKNQKLGAKIVVGLLVTAAITAASVLLKRHLENIKYEKKRLEELNKKFELNEATESEVKEAVELSEKILQICAMEDPRKTEIAIDELENEIVKEVA